MPATRAQRQRVQQRRHADLPDELIRKSETIYKTEIKGKKLTDDQLIIKMIEHPKLIERPILVLGNKATIGRPAENFMSIMG